MLSEEKWNVNRGSTHMKLGAVKLLGININYLGANNPMDVMLLSKKTVWYSFTLVSCGAWTNKFESALERKQI